MPMRWVMLLLLFLVRLSMGYQFQSVASLSSTLVEEFGFSYAEIGTLIGFFLLPGIVVSIPSGLMTRAVTDKNLLMLGAGAMVAGGIVMGMAANPSSLYWGRLLTGIGGSIFNVILTKMVSEWFFEKEIVTALGIMLTAWPIGIVLGLHTLAPIGELYGWNWAMYATAGLALFGLLLTLWFYREAPAPAARDTAPPRFGLPMRQFIHMSAVAIAWTMLNAALIVAVSFGPGALVESGYDGASARTAASLFMWVMLFSLPLGGRAVEMLGYITPTIVVCYLITAGAMLAIAQGLAPEFSYILAGLCFGLPAGAVMALTAEAVSSGNRGPGLGIFYTWYFVGMTVAPALAGWSRDISGTAAAPIFLAAGMMVMVILFVGLLRLLQRIWPIETDAMARPAAND